MGSKRNRNHKIRRLAYDLRILFLLLGLAGAVCILVPLWGDKAGEEPAAGERAQQAETSAGKADNPLQEQAGDENTEPAQQAGDENTEPAQQAGKPERAQEEPEADSLQEKLSAMSLEQKAAQLFFVTPEDLTGAGTAVEASEATKAALADYPVAGILYFKKNLVSREQIREMLTQTAAYGEEIEGMPLFLGVDEEGGSVVRLADNAQLEIPNVGNMADIGKTGDLSRAYEAGMTIGSYLRELGFNTDFAPDADVLLNQENTVVKKRSFGSDGELGADMTAEQIRAFEENRIYCALKHFPGHGATSGDTHDGYAYTQRSLEQLRECELVPFRRGIEMHVPFIMVGHFAAPQVTGNEKPCSLSYPIVTELLRQELQFEGIIITDAMNMGAISQNYTSGEAALEAIEAGCDMILMPADFKSAYQAVLDAVSAGRLTEERIDASVLRILRVKEKFYREGEAS